MSYSSGGGGDDHILFHGDFNGHTNVCSDFIENDHLSEDNATNEQSSLSPGNYEDTSKMNVRGFCKAQVIGIQQLLF